MAGTAQAPDGSGPATLGDSGGRARWPGKAAQDGAATTHGATRHGETSPTGVPCDHAGRGDLLFEYAPPRAHPIVYAGMLLSGFVLLTGSAEALLRGAPFQIYVLYAAPLLVLAALHALLYPSSVRIHMHGVAPSRPLLLRWHRPFVRWDALAAVYPSFYDVTGAFVSPFASSDGKVTQMGLGLEWPGGRTETVRFTPTRFVAWQSRSRGYEGALEAVRHAHRHMDRPLAPTAEHFTDEERRRLLAEASRPFLPFFAIVFLFASAAPVLLVLTTLGVSVQLALPMALLPPLGVSLLSRSRSRRRNRILDRLSKAAEHARGARQ